MFLINAIKPNGKEIKNLFFAQLLRKLVESVQKTVLFLIALGLLAATKTLIKRNEKFIK